MFMNVFLYVCICTTSMLGSCGSQKKALDPPGIGVSDGCDPFSGY